MNIIYVGLVLWPFVWIAVFSYACYKLFKWNFHEWRHALSMTWDYRTDSDVWLPGLAFLGFSMALSVVLWVIGLIPS
jgi:hypothetical protein